MLHRGVSLARFSRNFAEFVVRFRMRQPLKFDEFAQGVILIGVSS